ncbi:MAG: ornithine carbamoyltransferase [Planctomycetales bacterium]|nr:ornithine carbamoyltransferase [Planctomycetales bacterium]
MQRLVTLADLSTADVERIFAVTKDLKSKHAVGLREPILPGRVMALLFEKPSLRTRVSFEAAMAHLGGSSLFLGADVGFGSRESVEDFSRVLSEFVDVVVMRTHAHDTVVQLAEHCSCAVINGLTDLAHPCQALADLYTLRETFGDLKGRTLAYVGDGNNVARSLATGCAMLGVRFVLAAPPAYQFDDAFLGRLAKQVPGRDVSMTDDPATAVADAMAVYTDVWASMGQEAETEKRRRDFADYQVNAKLMSAAPDDAVFMHCLPAHRGDEVTSEVIDAPNSVVVAQAGNRMHVQKGILTCMLGTHA